MKRTVLGSGLAVVTERLPGFKTLSIGIWVRVGTRHETNRESGISHFLEHMVFKGTATRTATDITREIERVGGELNAFTAREFTCFHVTVLARDLELAMEILSDILLHSTFDAEEFSREKKVILQELAMVDESPEEVAGDIHSELMYGSHPLGRSILGTENSVRNLKRADLIRYFRKHYRPGNMIVSVAGDVSPARVMKSLLKLRKRNWPGRPAVSAGQRKTLPASAPPHVREGLWWIRRPTEQAHLMWAVETPKYASKDQTALILISAYLGGGMSSVLFQEIRERKGLAYTVYSSLTSFSDSGTLSIYLGANVGQITQCLNLIDVEVEKLCQDLVSIEALNEVRESLKGMMLLSSDSAESVMQSNAVDEIYLKQVYPVEQVCAELDSITPNDIRRVCRKVFRSRGRSILVYGPSPSKRVHRKLKPTYPKKYGQLK
ncbi:MAG: insulinase family protein [Cryobacterium sp.]|nr:insulinase family protein [Oligoflexia bacterium]